MTANRASNRKRNSWVVSLLDVQPDDRVLEIGFGPGLAILELSRIAHEGYVCGIDHSELMVRRRGGVTAGRAALRDRSRSRSAQRRWSGARDRGHPRRDRNRRWRDRHGDGVRLALEALGKCRRVAVVGDNLAADIAGARRAGLDAILVLTGAAGEDDLKRSPIEPDLVIPSIAALATQERAGRSATSVRDVPEAD